MHGPHYNLFRFRICYDCLSLYLGLTVRLIPPQLNIYESNWMRDSSSPEDAADIFLRNVSIHASPHGITPQKTTVDIFTALRTSDLTI
jgi:hypothetical protein